MEKFLFIPPVDESMPPLKAGQWVLLFSSFFVSLALFALFMLINSNHILFALLVAFVFPVAALPMQMYAMNRRGRLIGKLFLAAIWGIVLYDRRNWIKGHAFESLIVVLIALSVYWITHCIDQAGNLILKRLDVLQRRVNSVELKLDKIGRTLRHKETRSETEEI
jgi:hypothetical protein